MIDPIFFVYDSFYLFICAQLSSVAREKVTSSFQYIKEELATFAALAESMSAPTDFYYAGRCDVWVELSTNPPAGLDVFRNINFIQLSVAA